MSIIKEDQNADKAIDSYKRSLWLTGSLLESILNIFNTYHDDNSNIFGLKHALEQAKDLLEVNFLLKNIAKDYVLLDNDDELLSEFKVLEQQDIFCTAMYCVCKQIIHTTMYCNGSLKTIHELFGSVGNFIESYNSKLPYLELSEHREMVSKFGKVVTLFNTEVRNIYPDQCIVDDSSYRKGKKESLENLLDLVYYLLYNLEGNSLDDLLSKKTHAGKILSAITSVLAIEDNSPDNPYLDRTLRRRKALICKHDVVSSIADGVEYGRCTLKEAYDLYATIKDKISHYVWNAAYLPETQLAQMEQLASDFRCSINNKSRGESI